MFHDCGSSIWLSIAFFVSVKPLDIIIRPLDISSRVSGNTTKGSKGETRDISGCVCGDRTR